MQEVQVRPGVARAREELARAVADLRAAAETAHDDDAIATMVAALRASDELIATAVATLARVGKRLDALSGLPRHLVLALQARRTQADARALARAAGVLGDMPRTTEAFARGELSWAQVRGIVSSTRHCPAEERARLDAVVADQVAAGAADPDDVVGAVEDAAASLRQDLVRAREERAISAAFLSVEPFLGGGGGRIYGEADTQSLATILGALDAASPTPVNADDADAPSRAQQRMQGLVALCEQTLSHPARAEGTTRPRPRFVATLDLGADGARAGGAKVLWGAVGQPGRLSELATEVALCDAEIVPVVFDGTRPIAVGDAESDIPPSLRRVLIARDRRCRFPGCGAPVWWCDAHHILPRERGGPTTEPNLVLLCRRCHRRVHHRRWSVLPQPDGSIEFRHRGRRYVSPPPRRARE